MSQLDETHTEQAELKQLLNSPSVQVRERIRFFRKIKQIFLKFPEIARMPRFSCTAEETKKKKYKPDKKA